MNFNTFFFTIFFAVSLSLGAQPSTDEVLRTTAPSVTETTEMSNLASVWLPSSVSTDLVAFLPPSGITIETTVGVLLADIAKEGWTGNYRLYFPASAVRMALLIVE